ncbi:hypothetical protein PT974_06470 [Cladobotryum mycophilum]|uniref:Aminoglycoside phosphotransferase domain-containing protein n=1 Tax=Cladobotryum mycophilum TaxID=491253 RepID=A0ABR0SLI9_9HYPO
MASRSQTPPHQPTYGVHMSHSTIGSIVKHGFPSSKLISINQLPIGKSYNNRIYFLKLSHSGKVIPSTSDLASYEELELVLKVNGRFFGANKIENEVVSLRLLEAYCPDTPTPKVYARSGDGKNATFVSPDGNMKAVITILPSNDGMKEQSHSGWILMSRVPGDPIANLDLDEASMVNNMRQLADMATSWRLHIPPQRHCGNSCLRNEENKDQPADIHLQTFHGSSGTEVLVRGVLMDELTSQTPIPSLADYYRLRLEKKLDELQTSDVYAPNRSLAVLVRSFITDSLPRLGLDEAFERAGFKQHKFVFTHYDLSPRNVLVSGQPPQITGVVDFEFSGFFSPIEEFLNDSVGNDGDWPKAAYDAYLERLEQNGIATPGTGVDRKLWERGLSVENLVGNIAPWWLPGDREGEQLEEELKRVRQVVQSEIEKLKCFFN